MSILPPTPSPRVVDRQLCVLSVSSAVVACRPSRETRQMVVWVALSKRQRDIYVDYLGGQNVTDVLTGRVSSPLHAIAHLKKVMGWCWCWCWC